MLLAILQDRRHDLFHLGAHVLGLRVPGRILLVVLALGFRIRERQRAIAESSVGEEGLEAIVVLGQNWIELVIVAACAAKRHPEKRDAGDRGHVVESLMAALE